jgi:hypothetical protein
MLRLAHGRWRPSSKLAAFPIIASKEELVAKYRAEAESLGVKQWSVGMPGGVDFERLFNFEKLNTIDISDMCDDL